MQTSSKSEGPKFPHSSGNLRSLFSGEELRNDDKHPEKYSTHKADLLSPYSIQVMCSEIVNQYVLEVEMRLQAQTF